MYKPIFCIFVLFCSLGVGLIWPPGTGKIQIISGFGVPVDLKVETVIFGTVFKANYQLPKNLTELRQPFVTYARRKKRGIISRWQIYKVLEQMLEMQGFGGKSCMLRAICELVQLPLNKKYGIFNELLHEFFTPSSTKESIDFYSDNEYFAAQNIGKKHGNCGLIFSDCSNNLIDAFTMYD